MCDSDQDSATAALNKSSGQSGNTASTGVRRASAEGVFLEWCLSFVRKYYFAVIFKSTVILSTPFL